MKTRSVDIGPGAFSFQYTDAKHPLPQQWLFLGIAADGSVIANALWADALGRASWPSAWKRDLARDCFTHRRSFQVALEDLKRGRLLPPNAITKGTR